MNEPFGQVGLLDVNRGLVGHFFLNLDEARAVERRFGRFYIEHCETGLAFHVELREVEADLTGRIGHRCGVETGFTYEVLIDRAEGIEANRCPLDRSPEVVENNHIGNGLFHFMTAGKAKNGADGHCTEGKGNISHEVV